MYMVLDALSQASHNTSILLKMKLDVPPVKIDSVKLQDGNTYVGNSEQQMAVDSTPSSIVSVFEIWEIMMDENEFKIEKAYVVISAKYKTQGYAGGKWSDVAYQGFYTTPEEAKNAITGYLSED